MKALPQSTIDRMRRLKEVHTFETVAALVGVSKATGQKAAARGWKPGQGGPPRRQMPGDYLIQRDHLTMHQLRAHYGTGLGCIHRWEREAKTARAYMPRSAAHQVLPTPPDLAEIVADLGPTKAAAHFGVNPTTLQRMRAAAGLPIQFKSKKVIKEKARV